MTALEGVGFLVVAFLWTLLLDIRDQLRIERRRLAALRDAAFARAERDYEGRNPIPPLLSPARDWEPWDDVTAADVAAHYAEKQRAELSADLEAYEATEGVARRIQAAEVMVAIKELLEEVGGR